LGFCVSDWAELLIQSFPRSVFAIRFSKDAADPAVVLAHTHTHNTQRDLLRLQE